MKKEYRALITSSGAFEYHLVVTGETKLYISLETADVPFILSATDADELLGYW